MTSDTDQDIDTSNSLLGIDLDFKLALKGLTDAINEQRRDEYVKEQRRLNSLPNNVSLERVSAPAGTTDLVNFGGPSLGRKWDVRLLVAMSTDLATKAAVVTWYVGQPIGGVMVPTKVRWQFPSVPGFENLSPGQIVVRSGELLFAGLSSVPANSNIALAACVDDYPLHAQSRAIAIE